MWSTHAFDTVQYLVCLCASTMQKKKQHKDIVTFFSESSNTQWIGFIDCLLFAYYINKYLKCTYKVIQAAQSRGKSLAKVIYKHFFHMQLYFYAFSLTCRYFKSKHLTKQFLLDVNIIFDLFSPLSTAQTQYRFESYTMYCIYCIHIYWIQADNKRIYLYIKVFSSIAYVMCCTSAYNRCIHFIFKSMYCNL